MAWPSNPTNNQETTINGIVYRYDSTADVWQRVGMLGGDVTTDSFTTANLNVSNVASIGNVSVSHNVKSNLVPDTDVTYDLGSSSKRWKTLYLSGQTIDLGGTLISVAANGDITFGNVRFNSAGTINGSDITGAVSYATTANSVAGANVSGAVAYATTANSVAGANVSGAVAYATTANAVAGANVSGFVPNANVANTAFSVSASNISGTINLANYATTANSVAVGNVSGIGNIATINKDGNTSNILYGNGVFAAAPNYVNSNVSTFLASFGSNAITTTGDITAGNIIANGQSLTGMNGANVTGTVATANNSSYLGGTAAASYLLATGTGSSLTAITGANVTGTVATANNALYLGSTAANAYLLSTGTGSSLTAVTGANVTGNVANANLAGYVTQAAQSNITSLGSLANLTVNGTTTVKQVFENIQTGTGATGTVTFDISTGATFYHTSPAANFTAALTNLPSATNTFISVTILVQQGATNAYLPTAVTLSSTSTANVTTTPIKWINAVAGSGTINNVDVVSFGIIKLSGGWVVLGQYSTFG